MILNIIIHTVYAYSRIFLESAFYYGVRVVYSVGKEISFGAVVEHDIIVAVNDEYAHYALT